MNTEATPTDRERTLLDSVFEGVYYVDRERRITFWNRGAEELTGYSSAEVLGRRCMDGILKHVDDSGCSLCLGPCPLLRTMLDGRPREAQLYLHHREGHRLPVGVRTAPIVDPAGAIVGGVEVFRNRMTAPSSAAELEEFRRRAQYDELTALANRRSLDLQLKAKLDDMKRFEWPFGVLLIDIDHFKSVNDTYGHLVGDQCLKVVARTLSKSVREKDITGRWGGEEFLVIVPVLHSSELRALAERLRVLIQASTVPDCPDVHLSISIGASLARYGDTFEELLKRADALLYRSKDEGRNRVSWDAEALPILQPGAAD